MLDTIPVMIDRTGLMLGATVDLPDDEDLMTMEEVADMARMKVNALRYRIYHEKNGPEGFRLGKKRVFRKGKVRAWIKAIEDSQSTQEVA